ncbi:MAG TPA: hypothetical protein VF183_12195 [Acidimicrobiales bacterium]|jgi:hypothetical protein
MPPVLDVATGLFHIGGFDAGARTTSDAIVRHFGTALTTSNVGTWVHHALAPIVVDDERYRVTYLCERGALKRIEFTVWSASSASPTETDPWNAAKAQKERDAYEAWLTRRFGKRRRFSWGTVEAVFDARSTVSFIGIRYASVTAG